jgi:hypothetical protein
MTESSKKKTLKSVGARSECDIRHMLSVRIVPRTHDFDAKRNSISAQFLLHTSEEPL